ncbi:MAG TPA: hypothetical protein VH333_22435 [Pseudonocardiaceae bacterium]|jgi:hypothetical protein|nr:hypothetical protein [Pseudonocardiaceae bacterium]
MTASTAPSRTAQQQHRNGLGLSALGLGAAGILLGVFAAGAWFVVVPVGLLALIFGVFGVSQKRYYASDAATAVIGMIAGAVTLALGIWGTGTFLDGLHQPSAVSSVSGRAVPAVPAVAQGPAARPFGPPPGRPSGPPWTTGGTITWGQPHDFGNNVVVAISAPVAFTPASAGAGGAVPRSVVLSVTVTNCGTAAYRPDKSVYAPSATFDGHPLHQIPLPGGTVDAPKSAAISPGQSVGYRVAYTLPTQSGELHLTLRPNPNAAKAVIGGQA